jgi:acyl-CoA hydrolase
MTVFFSLAVGFPSGAMVCLFLSRTDCGARCCEVEVEVEEEEEEEGRRRRLWMERDR